MKIWKGCVWAICAAAWLNMLSICATAETESSASEADMDDAGVLLLFDFSRPADAEGWFIQDDGVMGGLSQGHFSISDAGHGVFSGDVSLENNGGFSSVRRYMDQIDVSAYSTAVLRVKGDGKRYQLHVKSDHRDWYHYSYGFQTGHDWEEIEIPLREMVPYFRGTRLDKPNYSAEALANMRLLVGNRVEESFHLEVDRIWLK